MSQQANPSAAGKPAGQAIVHVRQDSDHEMEAMFRVLTQPQIDGAYVPLRKRQLPDSFFKPPDHSRIGSHSREGSADSSTGFLQSTGLPAPHHSKSFSSPASLQETLSVATLPSINAVHPRQTSIDISSLNNDQPLPGGWEMAVTPNGERYFLNHRTQSTTWQDPRKSLSPSSHAQLTLPPPIHRAASPGSPQQSLNTNRHLGPLPPGWEQSYTQDGELYYINHISKSTSWFDPRIPRRLQTPNVKLTQLQSQVGGIPQQRLPPPVFVNKPQNIKYQQELQQLQQEKDLLARRQQQLQEQEMRLLSTITDDVPAGARVATSPAKDIQSAASNTVDPFLSQTGSMSEHNRQSSGDSGLGEMGTSFSLPRTPEDFLSNVDEMDSSDGSVKLANNQSDLDSTRSMDVTSLADDSSNAMDSEELMPSLQEDNLLMLNDLETVLNGSMSTNLTWL